MLGVVSLGPRREPVRGHIQSQLMPDSPSRLPLPPVVPGEASRTGTGPCVCCSACQERTGALSRQSLPHRLLRLPGHHLSRVYRGIPLPLPRSTASSPPPQLRCPSNRGMLTSCIALKGGPTSVDNQVWAYTREAALITSDGSTRLMASRSRRQRLRAPTGWRARTGCHPSCWSMPWPRWRLLSLWRFATSAWLLAYRVTIHVPQPRTTEKRP
jgi:hypothetical protein